MAVPFRFVAVLSVAVFLTVTANCLPTILKDELNLVREDPLQKMILAEKENRTLVDPNQFECETKLTEEQIARINTKQAVISESNLWPEAKMPYRFKDNSLNREHTMLGFNLLRQHTCLTFNEVSADVSGPHLIFELGNNCYSTIGRDTTQSTGQKIILSAACNKKTMVLVHEIMHAAGLFHEQQRFDRDDYVVVFWENVKTGLEHAFKKEKTNYHNTPFDYYSTMCYGNKMFSKNDKNTIESYGILENKLLGNQEELSFYDKKRLNTMYKCIDKWQTQFSRPSNYCKNDGYVGSTGICVCPDGSKGDTCQTKENEYSDALIKRKFPGSEFVVTEKTISSTGYPTPYQNGANFVKVIVAPECFKVKLTINGFDLYADATCNVDHFIINLDPFGSSVTSKSCGNTLKGKVLESVGTTMTLDYFSYDWRKSKYTNWVKGFSAAITHVPITGCSPKIPAERYLVNRP